MAKQRRSCAFRSPSFKSVETPEGLWFHVPWDSVLCADGIWRVPPDSPPRERAAYDRAVLHSYEPTRDLPELGTSL